MPSKDRLIDRQYGPRALFLIRLVAAAGLAIWMSNLLLLLVAPRLGLQLLWYAIAPLLPMVLLVSPNLWVSICPLSTLQTLPGRLGLVSPPRLNKETTAFLRTVGWALMFTVIPLRHLWLNTLGTVTLALAVAISLVALGFGFLTPGLSGWCEGACPIRPMEVLYGQLARDRRRPEICTACTGCAPRCSRARPEYAGKEFIAQPFTGKLAFGFPGFVAAYFLLDACHLCNREHRFYGQVATAHESLFWLAFTVVAFLAVGFALSYAAFWLLTLRGHIKPRLFLWSTAVSYLFYYCGIVPEIVEVWSMAHWLVLPLLAIPLSLLLLVALVPGKTHPAPIMPMLGLSRMK